MTAHLTPEKILQVGLGFWASKTLLSAVEMGVFTELADHPSDLEEVPQRLGLAPRPARVSPPRSSGVYHTPPPPASFPDPRKPSYLGGILEMANSRLYGFWGGLTE